MLVDGHLSLLAESHPPLSQLWGKRGGASNRGSPVLLLDHLTSTDLVSGGNAIFLGLFLEWQGFACFPKLNCFHLILYICSYQCL